MSDRPERSRSASRSPTRPPPPPPPPTAPRSARTQRVHFRQPLIETPAQAAAASMPPMLIDTPLLLPGPSSVRLQATDSERKVRIKLDEKSASDTSTPKPSPRDRIRNFFKPKSADSRNSGDLSPSRTLGSLQSDRRTERQSFRSSQHGLVKNTKMSKIMYTTDEEVRDALTEFAVFIVFLVLTSLVTLSIRHAYMFYFNDTIKKLFTTRDLVVAPSVTISFEKLLTVPDWWDYLIYNFIVTLHGDMVDIPDETWKFVDYSPGETAKNRARKRRQAEPEEEGEATTSTTAAPDEMGQNFTSLEGRIFLHENLMLGAPRLRQIRVRKDSCYVNDAFIRYFNTCYADYASGVEEVGGKHGGVPYKTRQELDAMPIWTLLTFYNTGGYTVDLTYNKEKNLDKIKELKEKHWLDRGSRLCVLEFNLYNENTDTFQSIKLLAEIPPTGGVLPQAQLQTVKQFSFLTDRSLFMTVIYIFWYIMVVYYTIYEFKEMRKSGCAAYFKSLLNLLDALILLFCYLALGYNVWHTIKVNDMLKKAKDSDSYQSLDVLCFWNIMYVDMMAILAFLVWIKIFKFISFNKTLVQFTTTLKRCSKDLAGFSLMFGIVFLAYAQLGLLLFGTKHPDFRNFLTSILTMIRMILGDFQYNLIEQANRVLGPIYFLTYILLVFFILLNMFLAIIMETYNSVKSEITQGRSQLGAYIYKKLKTAFQYIKRCGRKNRRQQVPEQHEDPENFETAPTSANDTIKPELRNMSESEARYFQDVPPDIEDKDSYRLNNRVALLEEILEQLITNMDAILKRVEKESKKTK